MITQDTHSEKQMLLLTAPGLPKAKTKAGLLAKSLFCTVFFPVLVAVLAVGGCLRTELPRHQMRCQEHMDCLLSHDNSTWMLLADTDFCYVPLGICSEVDCLYCMLVEHDCPKVKHQ